MLSKDSRTRTTCWNSPGIVGTEGFELEPLAGVRARRRNPDRKRSAIAWWARRDLNPQPRDYESPALTIELQAR